MACRAQRFTGSAYATCVMHISELCNVTSPFVESDLTIRNAARIRRGSAHSPARALKTCSPRGGDTLSGKLRAGFYPAGAPNMPHVYSRHGLTMSKAC